MILLSDIPVLMPFTTARKEIIPSIISEGAKRLSSLIIGNTVKRSDMKSVALAYGSSRHGELLCRAGSHKAENGAEPGTYRVHP